MESGYVPRNQAHSQPILPSHKSRYFHNGTPRLAHSQAAIASSRGLIPPLQARQQQQPHPFFTQGPAAMGYIPQYAPRYPRHPGLQEPIVPLRTQFYDASNVRGGDRPTTSSQAQHGTLTTKSSSLKVVPNAAQPARQYTTDKTTSSHKTAQCEKSLASQPQPLNKPANSKEKGLNKRSNDACATNHEAPEPPIKVRLVNRYTDHSRGSSQQMYNTPTSTFTWVNKHASQEYQHSQILPGTLEGDGTSGSLDSVTGAVGVSSTQAEPSRARELSQPRPTKGNQNIEAKTTSVTPVPILEQAHRTLIDPSLYSHQDRNSASEILPQLLTQSFPIRDEPVKLGVSTSRVTKRSASQATTVSGTSTQPSCTAENEDVPEEKDLFNPMSMIDEMMILDRDLSDIVSTRLQEGKPDMLDALYGEILIKMAVKDEGLFEAVSRML
ncbi:hypothetical protein F5B21DRAFT_457547, partial [Xylaria acuta]